MRPLFWFMEGKILDTAAQRLIRYWASQGYTVKPGALEQTLATFELKYKVRLPTDLREYFAKYGGFEGRGNWDSLLITFWPIQDVVRLSDVDGEYALPHGLGMSCSFFVFGDYSIESHLYEIRLTMDPAASCPVVAHEGRYVFGDSFSAFVDVYLSNPILVASPPIPV